MFKKNLTASEVKEIILAGKDANCSSIVYNGLHIIYKENSTPSNISWPEIPTPTIFNEADNPTKQEVIGDEAQILSSDLQFKLHEDPVAFEEALAQGAEWTRKKVTN